MEFRTLDPVASTPVATLESLAGAPVTVVFTDVEALEGPETRLCYARMLLDQLPRPAGAALGPLTFRRPPGSGGSRSGSTPSSTSGSGG